jgi:E3 ubiquitin-protein ligase HERC2
VFRNDTLLIDGFQVIGDSGLGGLDEFTSLLTENDARLLVDLLKLAVADRIEDDQAKEILSSVLITLGSSNKSIGAMLLELCVTELEDTANSTQSLSSTPHPVVQESSHPYIDDVTLRGTDSSIRARPGVIGSYLQVTCDFQELTL